MPFDNELLQSQLTPSKSEQIQRNSASFVAPDVKFEEIAEAIHDLRMAEYDGFVEVECLRGCCLIFASKINDKFDVECTLCKHWFHSSCLFKIFRLLKADINHIAKLITANKFVDEEWCCPICTSANETNGSLSESEAQSQSESESQMIDCIP
eukprot:791383_1